MYSNCTLFMDDLIWTTVPMIAGDVVAGILTIFGLCQCLYWCQRRVRRRRRYPRYHGPDRWSLSPHDFGASLAAVGEMLIQPTIRDGEISRASQQSAGMANFAPMGTRSLAGTMANRPLPPLPGYDTFGTVEQAALPTQGRDIHRHRLPPFRGEPSSVPPAMFDLNLDQEQSSGQPGGGRGRNVDVDECYTTPVSVKRIVTPVMTHEEPTNAPPPVPRHPPVADDRPKGARPKSWRAPPAEYANVPVPTARRHPNLGVVSAASFPGTPETPDLKETVL